MTNDGLKKVREEREGGMSMLTLLFPFEDGKEPVSLTPQPNLG